VSPRDGRKEAFVPTLKRLVSRVLNGLGLPAPIRASECRERFGVPVEVKIDDTFTTVHVSNVRLLFRRLSGRLDGVVLAKDDCRKAPASTPAPREV
jgi:hypothetical protein